MFLRTLGGLSLGESSFTRPKPLLLLAYLALEGPKERRFLAELFWLGATDPLNRLSSTLTRLRKAAPGVVDAGEIEVRVTLESDARQLLDAIDVGAIDRAVGLYAGPFLKGVYLPDWGTELEEWVYHTREFIAGRLCETLVPLAERAAARGKFVDAARHAEIAVDLLPDADPSPDVLERLHTVLIAGGSRRAGQVRAEAEEFGASLVSGADEARERLSGGQAPVDSPRRAAVPRRSTEFVGRLADKANIARLLLDGGDRLITLVGPAGVGKTRLGLQVANELRSAGGFDDGVFFVSLEAVRSDTLIASSIADALDVWFGPQGENAEHLAAAIGDHSVLLVLDNFEHVVDGAVIVSDLLAACPNLRVLTTSRERLNLDDELVYVVGGMLYPDQPVDELSPQEAQSYDAVRLFVQRARRAYPAFSLSRDDLGPILRICRLVDGLPLGLELAAAWVRAMPCADIADEIERNLDLLTTPSRDAFIRHRSVRSAFEYSWALLTPNEQTAWRRMGVFRGGFRRDAAGVVAGATIPALAALTDKSLLRLAPDGRYATHPLLQQYMREKLAEEPDVQAEAEQAHTKFYLAYLGRWGKDLWGGRQKDALAALAAEKDNIIAAWRWAVPQGWLDEVERYCSALEAMYVQRNRFREGLDAFHEVEELLDERDPYHRKALGRVSVSRGQLLLRLGRTEDAAAASSRGIRLLREANDAEGLVEGLNARGMIEGKSGEFSEARQHFTEALRLAREVGDLRLTAMVRNNLGIVEKEFGNYELAAEHYEGAISNNRALGNDLAVVRNVNNLGGLYLVTGRLDDAATVLREAARLAREMEFQQVLTHLLGSLGAVYVELQAFDAARDALDEALQMARASGEREIEAEAQRNLARIAIASGNLDEGEERLLDALDIARAVHSDLLALKAMAAFAELRWRQGRRGGGVELLRLVMAHAASNRHMRQKAREQLDMWQAEADRAVQEPAGEANRAAGHGQPEVVLRQVQEVAASLLAEAGRAHGRRA